jgi:hypothetical protein
VLLGVAPIGHDRRDVDDRALAGPFHDRKNFAAAQERAVEVDRHHPPPLRKACRLRRPGQHVALDARGIDQDVDYAMPGDELLDHLPPAVLAGDVEPVKIERELAREFLAAGLGDVGDRNDRALGVQRPHRGRADTAGSARYQRNLAFEAIHRFEFPGLSVRLRSYCAAHAVRIPARGGRRCERR